jgi:hypothetical protein
MVLPEQSRRTLVVRRKTNDATDAHPHAGEGDGFSHG